MSDLCIDADSSWDCESILTKGSSSPLSSTRLAAALPSSMMTSALTSWASVSAPSSVSAAALLPEAKGAMPADAPVLSADAADAATLLSTASCALLSRPLAEALSCSSHELCGGRPCGGASCMGAVASCDGRRACCDTGCAACMTVSLSALSALPRRTCSPERLLSLDCGGGVTSLQSGPSEGLKPFSWAALGESGVPSTMSIDTDPAGESDRARG